VPLWKLYDDANKVIKYETWNIVLSNILELGILPTILIYEKIG